MAGKKITTTVYITEDQNRLLKELNKRTRVPIAEFIREGIDMVLQKNTHNLPGQMELTALEKNQILMRTTSEI